MSDESDADREFWEEPADPWPDEPDEFDPFSLGPGVPEAPDPSTDEVNASAELMKSFWAAVVFANVGLLGVSLGPMLIVFRGQLDLGLSVFFIGALALLFAYRQYYGYVNRDDDTEATNDSGGGD